MNIVRNLLCDKEGVPLLIQKLNYCSGDMMFEVMLFNGKFFRVCSEFVCYSIGLMDMVPSRMQMLQAENNITEYVLNDFRPFVNADIDKPKR